MSKLTELQKQFLEIDRKIRNSGTKEQPERERILKAIAEEKKEQIARQIGGLV